VVTTPLSSLVLVLSILTLSGCAKQEPAVLRMELPEVKSLEELTLIRETLLSEQEILPEGMIFYHTIQATMQPVPRLVIQYDTRHLRRQNIVNRIHELGYTVEDRPGDPQARMEFLTRSFLR
jgi:hypothetical protein